MRDPLVESSLPILDEVHASSEGISDVVGALVEFNTPIPNDICVHEDDTSESDALHLPVAHDIPRKIQFAMNTITLLHIHIVFYRNLQLIMR